MIKSTPSIENNREQFNKVLKNKTKNNGNILKSAIFQYPARAPTPHPPIPKAVHSFCVLWLFEACLLSCHLSFNENQNHKMNTEGLYTTSDIKT